MKNFWLPFSWPFVRFSPCFLIILSQSKQFEKFSIMYHQFLSPHHQLKAIVYRSTWDQKSLIENLLALASDCPRKSFDILSCERGEGNRMSTIFERFIVIAETVVSWSSKAWEWQRFHSKKKALNLLSIISNLILKINSPRDWDFDLSINFVQLHFSSSAHNKSTWNKI